MHDNFDAIDEAEVFASTYNMLYSDSFNPAALDMNDDYEAIDEVEEFESMYYTLYSVSLKLSALYIAIKWLINNGGY